VNSDGKGENNEEFKWTEKRSWDEFRNTGLLWWINRTLQLFGWSIAVMVDDESGKIIDAFPIRNRYRGFTQDSEEEGFKKVSSYIRKDYQDFTADAFRDKDGEIKKK
jgi:hypothetical protein